MNKYKQEIRQNGKVMLGASDGLRMVFNNIIGKNLITDYFRFLLFVFENSELKPGKVEFWENGELVEEGFIDYLTADMYE